MVNVVIVWPFEKGFSVPQALDAQFVSALLCGMFNGFIVGVMRINPLLATLLRLQPHRIALWILPYRGGYIDFSFWRLLFWVICLGIFNTYAF